MTYTKSRSLWRWIIFLRLNFSLIVMTLILCGFSWGGANDPCEEASNLLSDSEHGITDQLAVQIINLCPDGAVGHLANGFQLEHTNQIEKAVAEYRIAINFDSTLYEAHGNLGLLLLNQGADIDAAAELIRALKGSSDPKYHRGLAQLLGKDEGAALRIAHSLEALKGNPEDTSVRIWLADAYEKQKQYVRAEEEYKKVLAKEPANEHARLGIADCYKINGKLKDAIKELKYAANANPSNKQIHQKLSELYEKKGDKELAAKEWQLADVKPSETEIDRLIQQGDQLLLNRNYDKAIEAYGNVLKKRPNWTIALEKLGDALMAAGRDDEAISVYQQIINIDPTNSSILYTLGVLQERKGLLDKAEAEFRKSLDQDPSNSDARRHLADIYTLRGNFQHSIEEYTELIKLRGDNPILHFKLARVYEKNKEFNKAIEEYLLAAKLAPENIETRKELAILYGRKRMLDEAEGQYREILRLDQDNEEIRNALISNLVRRKKYDDLLILLKANVALKPDDANRHYKLGVLYDFNKNYDSATEEYQKAIDLNSNHARAMFALGKLNIKKGNIAKAKTLLEAARAASPNFIEPRALLANLQDKENLKSIKHKKGKKSKKNNRSNTKAKKR